MVRDADGVAAAEQVWRSWLARTVTEVFAPAILVILVLLVVSATSTGNPLVGLAWGLCAALFCGALPYGFMILGVRRGRLGDRHIRDRRQRLGPLVVSSASVMVGVGLLAAGHGPREVLALVITMLTALVIFAVITTAWKISFHAAVAAGAVTTLVITHGPALLASAPLVALVAWSRVHLGDHTSTQVTAGAILGAAITLSLFPLLR